MIYQGYRQISTNSDGPLHAAPYLPTTYRAKMSVIEISPTAF